MLFGAKARQEPVEVSLPWNLRFFLRLFEGFWWLKKSFLRPF